MWRFLPCVAVGLLLILGPFQSGRAQVPKKEVVREAATEALADHYPERTDQLKLRVRRVRGDFDTTAALRLQFPENEGTPTGLSQVDIRTRHPGSDWEETGWALLHIARLDSVATVQGRVRRGESISPSELETAWIETTDMRGEPLQIDEIRSLATRGDLVATRHLQSGRVLRTRDVREPHTIDARSAVRVQYRRGRLSFRLSCTAREPGVVGEVVRAYCSELETMYRVRITGQNTAEWVETL